MEGGFGSGPGSTLFVDISNIDGFTAGGNLTGDISFFSRDLNPLIKLQKKIAFYCDGTTRNIHCCSGCPNTTDSPNCHGQGIYWFPTEIDGYGTAGWPYDNLDVLLLQWSCLSEADLTACNGVVCLNQGVCMGGMLGQCLCQPGWGSSDCSQKLDNTPCYQVNCGYVICLSLFKFLGSLFIFLKTSYYGTCNATAASAGGPKCASLQGYSGTLCTQPPSSSPCYGVTCGAQGICKNGFCECSNGFTGCTCEIPPSSRCTVVSNTNIVGNNLQSVSASSNDACCTACAQTQSCAAWTLSSGTCYLKSSSSGMVNATGQTSGYFPNIVTTAPSNCT